MNIITVFIAQLTKTQYLIIPAKIAMANVNFALNLRNVECVRMREINNKRIEVLEAIEPICKAFGIKEYDYVIKETGQRETLIINKTKIGCSCNSISAVINELIGYIFINIWCRDRSLGTFSTQTKNVIKRYWID